MADINNLVKLLNTPSADNERLHSLITTFFLDTDNENDSDTDSDPECLDDDTDMPMDYDADYGKDDDLDGDEGILDKSPHFQLAPNNLAPFIIRPLPNSPHTGSLL